MTRRGDGPRRRRRPVGLAVRVLVAAGVLHFLVLPQIGGTRRALGLIAGLDPLLIAAAVALEVVALAAYAQLSRSLLERSERPSLWDTMRVVVSSLAVNHLVPGGSAAGGVLQYRLLVGRGVAPADASFVMAAQSLGSALVLNALLWMGLIVSIPATGFQPVYVFAAGIGAVLILVVGAGVLALTRGRRRTVEVVAKVAGRFPRLDTEAIIAAFERAAEQLSALTAQRRRAVTALGWATANWLLDAAVLWVFLAAFGKAPHIPGLLVAYALANVLAAVPITPGGLGIVETTMVVTLAGFGVPRAHASLGVSAYRLIQFWLPIPVGAAAWASLTGRRGRELLTTVAGQPTRSDAEPGSPVA